MKLTCPGCGGQYDADAWINDLVIRQCFAVLAALPRGVARAAFGYIALFRKPGARRGMSWSKVLRLLTELRDMVADPYIRWETGPARKAGPDLWAQVLEQIAAVPPSRLPLTSHNYLRRVVYDKANELDKAREQAHNADVASGAYQAQQRAERQSEYTDQGLSKEHGKNIFKNFLAKQHTEGAK